MIRSRLESLVTRRWYGGQPPGFFLRLLETLYVLLFRWSQRRAQARFAVDLANRPIVVVGNITAGGTGKTPLVIRLCALLQAAGLTPGVVSSGYGREGKGLVVVDGSQPIALAGDEPSLIHQRTGVKVAVGPDRSAAARRLFQLGVDVVISDDGLQRPNFPRQFEICVVDGERLIGNGHLLPAGPLREPADRLDRVDAVVINGQGPVLEKTAPAVRMNLAPGALTRLDHQEQLELAAWQKRVGEQSVFAIAGIGHPQRFFALLTHLGIAHRARAFPDHHAYTSADFTGVKGSAIVMTEKDAVKCQGLGLANAWFLPVTARLPAEWEKYFVASIQQIVEQGRDKP